MTAKNEFVYILKPFKDNFTETATEEDDRIMGMHFQYLSDLLNKGILIMAGPETTGKFGICILETGSEEEAREIMNNDPAVLNGISSAELYPYRVSLIRK